MVEESLLKGFLEKNLRELIEVALSLR